jgi:hypothetical protein
VIRLVLASVSPPVGVKATRTRSRSAPRRRSVRSEARLSFGRSVTGPAASTLRLRGLNGDAERGDDVVEEEARARGPVNPGSGLSFSPPGPGA